MVCVKLECLNISTSELVSFLGMQIYRFTLPLWLLPASQAGRPGRCTPARLSTTRSCPSSLGPSLRTVSQSLLLPAVREEARMCVGVEKHFVVKTQRQPWESALSWCKSCLLWFTKNDVLIYIKKGSVTYTERNRVHQLFGKFSPQGAKWFLNG